ncbi:MAG: hypothetical protein K2N19_06765, partial [Muribaculaceae bacterium]|nr:hypothetical protein [Muribaculaceae bacterium]
LKNTADYDLTQTSKMHFKDPSYLYDDYWGVSFPSVDSYDYVGGINDNIKEYCKNQNTFRIGAEFRVTPQFSVRAGYSNISSPVKESAANGSTVIQTAGTMPEFRFDNSTNYYTAGLGFRTGGFYADLAYVHKQQSAGWHAFTTDGAGSESSPSAHVNFSSNQVLLSLGYKF